MTQKPCPNYGKLMVLCMGSFKTMGANCSPLIGLARGILGFYTLVKLSIYLSAQGICGLLYISQIHK